MSRDLSIVQIGQAMAASGYFPDATSAAKCLVRILAGRELGIGPVASMSAVYLVNGRVALSSQTIAALIRRSGRYDYKIKKLDGQQCDIEFSRRNSDGWEPCGVSSFTLTDARTAGLLRPGMPWSQYPRNMLFARAMTNGARWYTPDVFWGPVLSTEEAEAIGKEPTESVIDRGKRIDPEKYADSTQEE